MPRKRLLILIRHAAIIDIFAADAFSLLDADTAMMLMPLLPLFLRLLMPFRWFRRRHATAPLIFFTIARYLPRRRRHFHAFAPRAARSGASALSQLRDMRQRRCGAQCFDKRPPAGG